MKELLSIFLIVFGVPMMTFATKIRECQKPPERIPLHSKILFCQKGRNLTFHSKMRCRFSKHEQFLYHKKKLQIPTNILYECGGELIVMPEYAIYFSVTNSTEGVWNYLVEPKKIIPNRFIPAF